MLSEDERPSGGGVREHYVWSPEEISRLILAADDLGKRSGAQYNYAPLIQVLALTGLRVSEALALRWADVDLLDAVLHVRRSLSRNGELTDPKTSRGKRDVPLGPGLVDLLVSIKPEGGDAAAFVFTSRQGGQPVSYWNFRRRGFVTAIEAAGLSGKGITIHDLRSAAVSLYAAKGLTLVEVAELVGHADANVTARHYARLLTAPTWRSACVRLRHRSRSVISASIAETSTSRKAAALLRQIGRARQVCVKSGPA